MIRNDTASDARFWKIEPKAALYPRYKDIDAFRMFRFYRVVLKWFLVFYKNLQKVNTKVPLLLLKDISDTREFFPKDIPILLTKYPTSNNLDVQTIAANKDYLYAAVFLHFTENILEAQHHKPDRQKQSEASDWFEKEVELNIKDFAVPTLHIKDVQFPVLGPIAKLEEDFLELYSRAMSHHLGMRTRIY
ncbi:hypothetical protein MMC22_003494 [Lobaria immixta]|nr:hypothetical protein [Lobaria immixta]